ncbi:MAG: hypothetical protein P8Y60_04015 [Calditrichota bacterium]
MIEKITPYQKMTSLIGFTLKAGKFVIVLEAIRKELNKQQIFLKTSSGTNWKEKWGMENAKILGILKGDLGSNILKILKREH